MVSSPKRTVQVNVKMTADDLALLQRAAEAMWPGAVISNSGVVLGLARMAARQALTAEGQKKAASKGKREG